MAARKTTRREWGKVRELRPGVFQASYVVKGTRYNAPQRFTAKSDAQKYLSVVRSAVAHDTWVSPTEKAAAKAQADVTLDAYFETWLRNRPKLRPVTVEGYRRLIRVPLASLASLPLSSITATMVDRWYGDMTEHGKITQATRAYTLLASVFKHAVSRKLVASTPCMIDGAQTAKTGRVVTPPTDAELAILLNAIAPSMRALVIVAASGGLRWGEAIALRAKDVTVERAEDGSVDSVRLDVHRAAVRVGGTIVPGPTKTAASVRTVALFGQDARDVAEHVRSLIGDALLFPAADGVGFLQQSSFWRKYWNPARIVAGRPDLSFHALRHYAGTRYAQQGATPRETMARLGHESLGVAMRYQHATGRDDELARRAARR